MIRNLCASVLILLLTGCAQFQHGQSADSAIFEKVLAEATQEHPRHSEGDIIALKDGTLLAAWTDFSGAGQDHSTATVSAMKSKDGGKTWGAPFTLQSNIGKQNVMSISLFRSRSGDILFFFLVKNSGSDLKVLVRRSRDEACTWGDPVVVTPEPGYHIMNNARVIQLRSGRLLCPVSTCDDISTRNYHLRNVVYFSDDDGQTWKRGRGMVDVSGRGAMEPGLVELKNGNVFQVVRTQLGQIWYSTSEDGGDTWKKAAPLGLIAPEAPSTIARLPGKGELVLIYNPTTRAGVSGMKSRTPLVCSISKDEGQSWSEPKVIEADPQFSYAYTSVTFHKDRALLTYYYAPASITRCSWKLKSIPLNWFREP